MRKVLVLFLVLIVIISGCNQKDAELISVSVSINCATVFENYLKLDEALKNTEYIPENGSILQKTIINVSKGSSVLDALKAVAKENNIQLEYTQSLHDCYVEGINYVYEFSCGELSGWMYTVNGQFAAKGCSEYVLHDGDVIEWVYTCNLGKDIGESYKNGG